MWLVYSILALFIVTAFLAFIEDRIEPKQKQVVYYSIGLILVLLAGFREVGFDPDSEIYEKYFHGNEDNRLLDSVEYSFLLICQFFSSFTYDVHSVFVFYAFWGVMLKLQAFKKYSDSIFLLLMIYICYFFELHETNQIRTGILSAIMLFAIHNIAESRKFIAFLLIVLGSMFHLSGISLLPLLFLGNKPLSRTWLAVLSVVIPISYMLPSLIDVLFTISENIPYIGSKIARYNAVEETGITKVSGVNIFSPFHLMTIMVYYYMLFFYKLLSKHDKYFPLLMKIFAAGLCFYSAFSFLPVMGERLCMLYKIVTIVLFADLYHTLRPRWCGFALVLLVSFIYMNYVLRSMYGFTIFLSPNES